MSGIGTELGILNTIILICGALAAIFSKYGFPWQWGKKKKNNNHKIQTQRINPHSLQNLPGLATVCVENKENIQKLCILIQEIQKDLEKRCNFVDKQFDKVWDVIEKLRDRV